MSAICQNCERQGKKLREALTNLELIHILTAAASMRQHLDANINAPEQDKIVSSSVITKVLLAFPEAGRHNLLQQLRRSANMDLRLNSCGHGVIGVVS